MTVETQAPVTISYKDLLERPESLKGDIERALGSDEDCLGVILVKGVSFPLSAPPSHSLTARCSVNVADLQTCPPSFLN